MKASTLQQYKTSHLKILKEALKNKKTTTFKNKWITFSR